MEGSKRIKLFRGSREKMLNDDNKDVVLESGRPFYNKSDNYLYVGDGQTTLENLKPLNVGGNAKLGTSNSTDSDKDRQPDHIFEENSNKVKTATTADNAIKADRIKYVTDADAPTQDQPDGTLTIYVGDSVPGPTYKNVLYLIYF